MLGLRFGLGMLGRRNGGSEAVADTALLGDATALAGEATTLLL
jgi:hypothetical protein